MIIIMIVLIAFIFSACPNAEKESFSIVNNDTENQLDEDLYQADIVYKYGLNEDTILLKFHESAKSDIIYFNMHDDENTSVGAIISVLDCNFNGRFLELIHNGKRLVEFHLDNKKYIFDPNRIFTPLGVKLSLEKYGNYSKEAAKLVEDFGRFIVDSLLKDAKIIVALHNNFGEGYSIKNYESGEMFQNDAAEIFKNTEMDNNDFFYVTEKDFFEKLKEQNYNVLLQNNSNVTNDGSLSVYCGMNNIKYINIEAQDGHLEENIDMIKLTNSILSNL